MTTQTFFFYDLETSGINPRKQRIMQFAGQRTDMNLQPIGDPVNILVALSDDVLPEPDAVMITGITPQKTLEEGYTEAEFCKLIMSEVCTPGTIMTGFNSVRFDDEFMRYTLYRNFYDPYEWAWSDDRSRWDLLDVVRLTRALRPEGINWPVDDKGAPTNRLELLTKENGLSHEHAHDALSDVVALIAVTELIRRKQPKLFEYLLGLRDKKKVAEVVSLEDPKPFVYASGRYESEHEKTSVAFPIAPGLTPGSVLVYDLRVDPTSFKSMDAQALAKQLFAPWEERKKEAFFKVPIKELALNKCPAVAPLGVLDAAAEKRIHLSLETIQQHYTTLNAMTSFCATVKEAYSKRMPFAREGDVDSQLYDGFFNRRDAPAMAAVRQANRDQLADIQPNFSDERLEQLLLRYKARNFPQSLSQDEEVAWNQFRSDRYTADIGLFVASLERLSSTTGDAADKQFLLQELQLWATNVGPSDLS